MKTYIIIILVHALLIIGCRKQIELDLPTYEPKLVLEFYLESNKPLSCLLQESVLYTDTTKYKLINNALVILSYNGIKDTLSNTLYFDPAYEKIYNYHNPKIIQLQPNTLYELYVKDAAGREMTGRTMLNSIVPISSLVYNLNENNRASVGLVFNDNRSTKNYYRIVAFRGDSLLKRYRSWDVDFDDILFNGEQFSFYTRHDFYQGDTVTGRLYHLTEEHHNFTQSVENAQSANGNPFGQPANIISNVNGGIGVFTTLIYDEKKIIIQ